MAFSGDSSMIIKGVWRALIASVIARLMVRGCDACSLTTGVS